MQRESGMLRVAIDAAQRIVYGDPWAEPLLDGLIDVIGIDAGAGITFWRPNEPGHSELKVVTRGAPPLSREQLEHAMPFAAQHPLMGVLVSGQSYAAARVSDRVSMPRFRRSVVYQAIHGVSEGRFPASVSFGTPGGAIAFAGFQRRDRDFSDDDMQLMQLVRRPIAAALAFRAQLDQALARLDALQANGQTPNLPLQPAGDVLTARQQQVWAMVAAGYTNTHISHILGVKERTVRKHVEDLYLRLNIHNRATAATLWTMTKHRTT